jgi:hypothetical protein
MCQRVFAAAFAALALTGCGAFGEVRQPPPQLVSVPCVAALPERPLLLADDAWKRNADEFERVRSLMVDRAVLKAHVGTLEAVLRACVK